MKVGVRVNLGLGLIFRFTWSKQKITGLLHMLDANPDEARDGGGLSLTKTAQTAAKHLIYKKRENQTI